MSHKANESLCQVEYFSIRRRTLQRLVGPQTGKLNLRDGTITTGGNNSVETTWQRERKLVTISWYTEIYF